MTTITTKLLDELLDYLDKSIESISKDVIKNSEFHTDMEKLEEFLSSQYDIRLENLLKSKNSSIHHLESGMKNKVIQKKKKIIDSIKSQAGF